MAITLLIAEDDALLRRLLPLALAEHTEFQIVGTAGTGRDALSEVARLKPEVLLLDLRLPDMSGLRVLERLAETGGGPRVLVLTGEDGDGVELEVARCGARGFLHKSNEIAQLPACIRAIASGGTWFSRSIIDRIVDDYPTLVRRTQEKSRPIDLLSEREREVLIRVARGVTNKEIAAELYMSLSTVKAHIRSFFQKLGLSNRTEAAMFALREGLVEVEPGRE